MPVGQSTSTGHLAARAARTMSAVPPSPGAGLLVPDGDQPVGAAQEFVVGGPEGGAVGVGVRHDEDFGRGVQEAVEVGGVGGGDLGGPVVGGGQDGDQAAAEGQHGVGEQRVGARGQAGDAGERGGVRLQQRDERRPQGRQARRGEVEVAGHGDDRQGWAFRGVSDVEGAQTSSGPVKSGELYPGLLNSAARGSRPSGSVMPSEPGLLNPGLLQVALR